MIKALVGLIFILALALGGFFLWKTHVPEPEVIPPPPEPVIETSTTYSSSTLGYSIKYPKDFRIDEDYAYDAFGEAKLIHGVKFLIPESMATGTNVSAFDTGISIESLPRAKSCTGDIYLLSDVSALRVSEGGVAYSVASSTQGAAGNRYEEIVYALASSTPCVAVRYFIHTMDAENYDSGTVTAFDRAGLIKTFDEIRTTLQFAP